MFLQFLLYASIGSVASSTTLKPRLDNGLALTPQMGWNTYNHYSCSPNETIVHSNAQALVDLGLSSLGYRYVTTDCGWTVADRLPDGSLTWNDTLFSQGFPAMGEYLHDLGLLFGVYQDSGILLCGSPPDQAGSLYHEAQDAKTFASWNVDSLKYDNCYSDAATDYPNVNYAPSTSPEPRFANMSHALLQQNRTILFQICEWGISFPAGWAPSIGHSWRIGNDIIPDWRTIFRTINQAAPQTDFASPGQWPDLDMLEVGNNIFSLPEEETHFSLWAILKSPLIIGAALKDEVTAINDASLEVLKQTDVISFNQDSLGKSASLRRRWTEEGYEVWSGPLYDDRTVAAVINWRNESRDLTLDLPDIGLQYAGIVKNIWDESTAQDVRTSYTATVAGHGTMLLELQNTTEAGVYTKAIFGTSSGYVYF
ncbi:glycoside hydrolase [Aspergillus sclerotioniger CBS 115572]|uniref:Alpha-galactosidase n=1 Tax=Aspergillus sclerotioniger CBS 115572 TaxID=1450535 RepID=A0A317XBD9_9EURO|nr:glycoside hydrolase [Aspergillus sclerotioniger CBS 115572]PWY93860.1 glycoside hydrolase [Aspergillus sclerotioniger CBS 115572]